MKAAVYRGIDRVQVEEVPLPALEPGEILVRVGACGVCGTDLKKIHHGLVPPPRIFGHEIAGTVAEVGPNESAWSTGDRVVVQHHVPCGECFYCHRRQYAHCPTYLRTGTTAGFEPAGGGFAEYVRVMPFVRRGIVAIPDGVSDDEACFLEPLNTVLKGVLSLRPEAGECAVVLGQGPIGLLFTQALILEGLHVIGSDPLAERRDLAASFGAEPIDPTTGGLEPACRLRTSGRGADLAVVAVAVPGAVTQALAAVRPGGRVLLFAQTRLDEEAPIPLGQVCVREKALLGSYSSDIDLQDQAAALLFTRTIRVAPLIRHRFPLQQIGEALRAASQPQPGTLKVVVHP